MKEHRVSWILACIAVLTAAMPMLGQAPSAPIIHEPGTPVPQAPEERIRKRVLSVTVPLTVTNAKGELVSNLEAKDFQVTDNGVPQKIMYLDLGPTPLSMVFLVETSSRIGPVVTEVRKRGMIFAVAMVGRSDAAVVVCFNGSVDRLAAFTESLKPTTTASSFGPISGSAKMIPVLRISVRRGSMRELVSTKKTIESGVGPKSRYIIFCGTPLSVT